MKTFISRNWTTSERSYLFNEIERRLMGNIRAGQMGDYLARKEALRTWTSEQLEAQSDWLLSGFDVTREEAPKRKIIEE